MLVKLLLLFLSFAAPAGASIALDAIYPVTANYAGSGTVTWAHTCTGSNLILVIAIWSDSASVSAVTVDGAAATFVVSSQETGSAGRSFLYYKLGISAGSHTVSATSAGQIAAASASYTGAKQSGQPDASASNHSATGDGTVTLTTVAGNSWIVGLFEDSGVGGFSSFSIGVPPTYTPRYNFVAAVAKFSDSAAPYSPAGSYTFAAVHNASVPWSVSAMSIAPATASVAAPRHKVVTQ